MTPYHAQNIMSHSTSPIISAEQSLLQKDKQIQQNLTNEIELLQQQLEESRIREFQFLLPPPPQQVPRWDTSIAVRLSINLDKFLDELTKHLPYRQGMYTTCSAVNIFSALIGKPNSSQVLQWLKNDHKLIRKFCSCYEYAIVVVGMNQPVIDVPKWIEEMKTHMPEAVKKFPYSDTNILYFPFLMAETTIVDM